MAGIFVGTVLGAAVLRPSYASVRRMQKAIAVAGCSFHDGSCRHPEHLLTGQLRQWTGQALMSFPVRTVRKDPCSGGPWKALRVIVDHAKAHAPGEFGPGAQNSLGKFGPCTGPELESELHELSERGRTDSH